MRSDALSRVAGQEIKGRVWIIKSLTLCWGIATQLPVLIGVRQSLKLVWESRETSMSFWGSISALGAFLGQSAR